MAEGGAQMCSLHSISSLPHTQQRKNLSVESQVLTAGLLMMEWNGVCHQPEQGTGGICYLGYISGAVKIQKPVTETRNTYCKELVILSLSLSLSFNTF